MAAPATANHAFRYTPLPDSKTYLRLLQIKFSPVQATVALRPRYDDQHVECEIATWPMSSAPPYRAISYTWGEPEATAWIRVNHKDMQVRHNCEAVLRQVHQHCGVGCYFWLDAICINQGDNLEKSLQVAMMGQIFQKAELVLACLGAHDEYSRFLTQNLKQNSDLFIRTSKYYGVSKSDRKFDVMLGLRVQRWRIHQRPVQLVRALFEFLCRPYFRRVWTFPEMQLARNVGFLCGDDSVLPLTLFGLSLLVARGLKLGNLDEGIDEIFDDLFSIRNLPVAIKAALAILSYQKVVRQTALSRFFPLWTAAFCLQVDGEPWQKHLEHLKNVYINPAEGRIHHGHLLAMVTEPSTRHPLEDILGFTRKLECEHPRDRIYAVLSIVDWGSGAATPIQPDYESDVYDLLKNILPWLWYQKETTRLDGAWSLMTCQEIIKALQLDIQTSPKLARAIDDRRHDNPAQSISGTVVTPLLVGFRGFRVLGVNGALTLDIPPHWNRKHAQNALSTEQCCLLSTVPLLDEGERKRDREAIRALTQKAPQQQFQVVFDKHDRLCAFLPHHARHGDWIITNKWILAGIGVMSLVLREQAKEGQFYIVGEAVVKPSFVRCVSEVGTKFSVALDTEDLIVLCRPEYSAVWPPGEHIETLVDRLGNRMCSALGSSYAVAVP